LPLERGHTSLSPHEAPKKGRSQDEMIAEILENTRALRRNKLDVRSLRNYVAHVPFSPGGPYGGTFFAGTAPVVAGSSMSGITGRATAELLSSLVEDDSDSQKG
jgi:hypothetical protein